MSWWFCGCLVFCMLLLWYQRLQCSCGGRHQQSSINCGVYVHTIMYVLHQVMLLVRCCLYMDGCQHELYGTPISSFSFTNTVWCEQVM
jgi:hypothetical protein